MTRKSRVLCRVEVLESRAVPTAAMPIMAAPAVALVEYSPGSVPTATSMPTSTPVATSTVPNPVLTETVLGTNVVGGTYARVGRSIPIKADGNIAPLGQVSVTGSIMLSGRRSSQNLSGALTFSGGQGSMTLQLAADNVRAFTRTGPLTVAETVTATTGDGDPLQGETGKGLVVLGRGATTARDNTGRLVATPHSFWMLVRLNSPTD